MNSIITTKNKEKLDLLLKGTSFPFKSKKDLLHEKHELLKDIRTDVKRTYDELLNNMPVSYDEYGNEPEKISYNSYAIVKALGGLGTGLYCVNSLSEFFRNPDYFSGWEYGLMPAMVFVSTFLVASAINDYKLQNKMDNTKLVVSTIDKFYSEQNLDLNDLDKIYHSEFQYVVSLMASMNCVEARKVRYKNYLIMKIDKQIAEELRDSDTFPA